MDRTADLTQLFEASGLKAFLVTKGQYHQSAKLPEFSKLKFEGNDFRIASIELYDLQQDVGYFRVHHHPDAPDWLREGLRAMPDYRALGSTAHGTNFESETPLVQARALAELLAKHS